MTSAAHAPSSIDMTAGCTAAGTGMTATERSSSGVVITGTTNLVTSREMAPSPGPFFCPTGKSVNCCLPPFAKIFLFRLYPNHFYIHRRLAPLQGRIAIVTDAGRDAVDAAASGV